MTDTNTNSIERFIKLPYLYFIIIFVWNSLSHLSNNTSQWYGLLIVSIPFMYQLVFEKRVLTIILGCLTLIWSCWMTLAFLSDVAKINPAKSSSGFVVIGGTLVILNFIASFGILRRINAGENKTAIA